jgi:hypothetical protein
MLFVFDKQINHIIIIGYQSNKYLKFKSMSTTEYYRLALLQYIKMQHNL